MNADKEEKRTLFPSMAPGMLLKRVRDGLINKNAVLPRLASKVLKQVEQIGCVTNNIFMNPEGDSEWDLLHGEQQAGFSAQYPECYDDFGATELDSARKVYNIQICQFYKQKSGDSQATAYKEAVLDAFDKTFPTPEYE